MALALLAPAFLGSTRMQREAEKDTNAILEASYLYNIAKLVEWKDPAMRNGNFVIGVIGGPNVYAELIKKYASKMVGRQPIEVRKLPRSADVDKCHILFVARSEAVVLPQLYKKLLGKGTLLATEYPDALEDGAVVNFIKVENTLRYELSVVNAHKQKLEIASTLKNLAQRVEE